MSHTYPLAQTAHEAVASADKVARTRHEAEMAAGGQGVASLQTEWLTPSAEDLPALLERASEGPASGFLQHYEDASGNTVLAVTYWKLAATKKASKPKPAPPKPAAPDHTDDLYFRHDRARKRKAKKVDQNQLDLFGKPKPPED